MTHYNERILRSQFLSLHVKEPNYNEWNSRSLEIRYNAMGFFCIDKTYGRLLEQEFIATDFMIKCNNFKCRSTGNSLTYKQIRQCIKTKFVMKLLHRPTCTCTSAVWKNNFSLSLLNFVLLSYQYQHRKHHATVYNMLFVMNNYWTTCS